MLVSEMILIYYIRSDYFSATNYFLTLILEDNFDELRLLLDLERLIDNILSLSLNEVFFFGLLFTKIEVRDEDLRELRTAVPISIT
jgi:hypothetical protein